MATDFYSTSGEFYEMVADRHVRTSAGPLTTALRGVDPALGPVVEIGAGTGQLTRLIAGRLPAAEIVAVEPATPMRAVLTSRVLGEPDLRRRVTVVAGAAPDLVLPDRISAVVAFGVLGHLGDGDRARLWDLLRPRLPAGAPVVVELMGGHRARRIEPIRMLRETIGAQTYEWWTSAEVAGPRLMRWRTTWKVFSGHEVVRTVEDAYDWTTLSLEDLAAESGMTARHLGGSGVPGSPEIGVLVR
ncbi:class I SAM-dependent methyltransferase [Catenuloplanes indicus]|uniref:SAM-dependent methyltransferase n=1 Tax=Catenuloplanes indicus TaxID=137267 RepID=A0AAE3VTQ5_9ACTN|nr:class I SAM-dependent methyltransferase [Catenuloplanes indicus]MDQ0363536.1 SAM-dependent methyltransferase [Catenuloplanes indicus]